MITHCVAPLGHEQTCVVVRHMRPQLTVGSRLGVEQQGGCMIPHRQIPISGAQSEASLMKVVRYHMCQKKWRKPGEKKN